MNAYKKFGYYYDEMMASMNYGLWLEFVEEYLKPGDTVLDLACGTATLCTMLKLSGYEPEGLDLSSTILEIAQEKMKINHLNFPLYNQDMINFETHKKYDMITCFFDSVNFLKDTNEIKRMLDQVVKHLKDDGYFICDIFSKEMFKEYSDNHLKEDHGTFKIDWLTKKVGPTSLKHNITIIEDEEEIKETYNEYYYEIREIAHKNLKLIKISGDFNDDLEDEDERILLVFQKTK